MIFEFRPPPRLIFGEGAFQFLGEAVAEYGRKALIVTGRRAMQETGHLARAQALLQRAGVNSLVFAEIPANPVVEVVNQGAQLAQKEQCEVIIGLGGGSAMDAAKAIAISASHERPIQDFMIAPGGQTPATPSAVTLPVICVTSTAGTSSELTPFAVLTIPELPQKSAIRSPYILPRVAIEDPELTYSVPPDITAATGIDVLCHALEAFISNSATPLTDVFAQEAIRLVGLYLPRVYRDGTDAEGRRQMMLANALAGYSLACCGATIMHGLEHPLSAYYPHIAHGVGLAAVLRVWAQKLWPQMPARFARVTELLGYNIGAMSVEQAAQQAEQALAALLQAVGLNQRLRDLGVERDLLPKMAQDTCRYMSVTVNKTPGQPSYEDVLALLEAAY